MHSLPSSLPVHPDARALYDVISALHCEPLRHALGCAADVRRRCLVNREPAERVAKDTGLSKTQVQGAVRLLASGRYSPERLACVVMLDWGMEDEDIAEIFNRSVRWARVVRSQAEEIRKAEPIPADLEYLDGGLGPEDPSPAEIAARCKEVLALRRTPPRSDAYRPGIRAYSWRGDRASFIPNRVA